MPKRFFVLLALLAVALTPSIAWCGLCVNEIMADPATDWDGDGSYSSVNDEWVELYNSGPAHVNLGEFELSDDTGYLTYGFNDGDDLGVGEAIVIYGSMSKQWQAGHGVAQYGFRLGNDGDTVILRQIAGGDTLLVDSHTFNTFEAEDDRSTGREPDGIGSWRIFDALNPYTGPTPPPGNGLAPTPGRPNAGDPPPVEAAPPTWGEVKSLFR
jgi:hypothetical protein